MIYISFIVPLKVLVVVPFVIGIEGTTIVTFPPLNVAVTSTAPTPVLTHAGILAPARSVSAKFKMYKTVQGKFALKIENAAGKTLGTKTRKPIKFIHRKVKYINRYDM